MKRIVILAAIVIAIACICGCGSPREPMPELSSEYYVGITFGGEGYGDYYDCFQGVAIVCTNKDLLVYMPGENSGEYVVADTLKITDAQYDGIVKSLNRKKLYYLYANEQIEEGDGDSSLVSIMLYDENNELLLDCGGYKPDNEYFNSAVRALNEYLPMEELNQIRSDWPNKLMEEDEARRKIYQEGTADEQDIEEHNEELVTEALGDEVEHFKMDTFHDICKSLDVGALQLVEAHEDGPDKYLQIIAQDSTIYKYFYDGSGSLLGVWNLDTGEWPYSSEE